MFQRLPSPAALRTFEAAARLGSFKAAADELGVTPTAVSHQIRALEEGLSVALFVRRARAVELTEAGASLAPALHSAFLIIRAAVEEVVAAEQVLTVTTTAAFATLRLAPRLASFEAAHPDLRVRIETGSALVDLKRDRRVDVAIRYTARPEPEAAAAPLITEAFRAYRAPDRFDDVAFSAQTLIETEWRQPLLAHITWSAWCAAAAEPAPPPGAPIRRYEEEHFVLQAALAGQGVALISDALVGDALRFGILEAWRPEVSIAGGCYTALCDPARAGERKIKHFLAWLDATFREAPPEARAAQRAAQRSRERDKTSRLRSAASGATSSPPPL